MAQKGGNRQQKQAAKAVRRKQALAEKRKAERLGGSQSARVAAAVSGTLEHCLRTRDIFEAGIGYVVVIRRLPSGIKASAFFLVDLFCLGVKDVFYREVSQSDLDEQIASLERSGQRLVEFDPASARKLVTGAVSFAASYGIAPHKDYRGIEPIFGDVDAGSSSEDFTFGRDGRPLFIPGPRDTPARMREIQRALERHGGAPDRVSNAEANLGIVRQFAAALGLGRRDLGMDGDHAGPTIEHDGSTVPPQDS